MVLFHLTVWCHPYIYKGIDEMKLNLSHREGSSHRLGRNPNTEGCDNAFEGQYHQRPYWGMGAVGAK